MTKVYGTVHNRLLVTNYYKGNIMGTYTPYNNLTDDELITVVLNKEDPTDLELELVHRFSAYVDGTHHTDAALHEMRLMEEKYEEVIENLNAKLRREIPA